MANIMEASSEKDLRFVGDSLAELRTCYPQFRQWYDEKVLPEAGKTRRIFFAVNAEGAFEGALILKDTEEEKKVCTLFVSEGSRWQNIGGDFLGIASGTLKTNKLPITVSDSVKEEFFGNRQFNFVTEAVKPDLYKEGQNEYIGYILYHESNECLRLYKRYAHGINVIQIGLIKKEDLPRELYADALRLFMEQGMLVTENDNNLLIFKEKE